MNSANLPVYVDGILKIYSIVGDTKSDYPRELLKSQNLELCFRQISVFDKTKYEMERSGHNVTMKVVIPRYEGINGKCVVIINGVQHEVYNAAHIVNKDGFSETELTLIKPEREREFFKCQADN